MTVNKLQRFSQISNFNHVLEHTDFKDDEAEKPAGKWNARIFENPNPITLELGCGRGSYTLELARRNPDQNYIGIDIKGARIWKGAKRAKQQELENVRFLRIFIDHLDAYFANGEVSQIWITFSDPFPRAGNRNKRLTSPKFLALYQQVLKKGGCIHFKTDDSAFFNYTCRRVKELGKQMLDKVGDIYRQAPDNDLLTIKTTYEKMHLKDGKSISYCKFTLS